MHRVLQRVRYADTDRMGFAHHAHYLEWFEVGRTEMIRSLGKSYREIEESGVSLPVLEVRCTFLRPSTYDDVLAIECGVLELARASVRFGYRVVREAAGAAVIAVGSTTHCFMNRAGRPTRPPSDLIDRLQRAPRVAEVDLPQLG